MTKYREILRLKSLGFSERNIAQSCVVTNIGTHILYLVYDMGTHFFHCFYCF